RRCLGVYSAKGVGRQLRHEYGQWLLRRLPVFRKHLVEHRRNRIPESGFAGRTGRHGPTAAAALRMGAVVHPLHVRGVEVATVAGGSDRPRAANGTGRCTQSGHRAVPPPVLRLGFRASGEQRGTPDLGPEGGPPHRVGDFARATDHYRAVPARFAFERGLPT
ncbi:MAG: hypothetical protein QOE15_2978, partial [Acidimicrobiaceae bacterium]|nr:hypothetical protein [Acidimicrobiaceae bacterium]